MGAIAVKDRTVWLNSSGMFMHKCGVLGHNVEVLADWKLCPWCGMGLTRKIMAISILDSEKIEWVSEALG